MFDVEETKSHSGVTLQTSRWKFCHTWLNLQSIIIVPRVLFSQMVGAVGFVVYWCVLVLSVQESCMSACICRSGSDFCIICFAVLGAVWLSPGVCKFSKSGRYLNILCVSTVLWNMSHTEDSQILGATVQNEATCAMLYPRYGSSDVVTQWSLQRCRKGNEASLSV
jgi:hypothetical protein